MNDKVSSPEDIYAIIVGIDIYDDRKDLKISGCARAALEFARWLLKYGVPPENIYLALAHEDKTRLYSEAGLSSTEEERLEDVNVLAPTSEAIRDIFNGALIKRHDHRHMKDNSVLFFYWQGHGLTKRNEAGRKRVRIVVTSNTKGNHTPGLIAEDIQDTFYDDLPKFTRQYFFMDVCGDIDEYDDLAGTRFPDLTCSPLRTKQSIDYVNKIKEVKQYNIFGARIGETAKYGIFSQCLLELLSKVSPLALDIASLEPELRNAQSNKLSELWEKGQGASDQGIKFVRRFREGDDNADEREELIYPTVLGPSSLPPERGRLLCQYDAHASYVVAVAWEPNGTRIASAGGDGTVRVWGAKTGKSLLTYRGHTHWLNKINRPITVYTVSWHPKGKRIVSAGVGASVHVWDAVTGQNLTLYERHSGLVPYVWAVAWSPDGERIASACSSAGLDKTVHLWDAATGQPLTRYSVPSGLMPNFSVLSLAWSPDGTRIAATCDQNVIRVWNTETGQLVSTHRNGSVSHIAWSPDSRYLALAQSDHKARVWDTSTEENVTIYCDHKDSVRYVAWSPDGTSLATASNDKTVHIWEPLTGKRIYVYEGHSDWTTSVAWSPDGTRIASASNDRTVHVWQAVGDRRV